MFCYMYPSHSDQIWGLSFLRGRKAPLSFLASSSLHPVHDSRISVPCSSSVLLALRFHTVCLPQPLVPTILPSTSTRAACCLCLCLVLLHWKRSCPLGSSWHKQQSFLLNGFRAVPILKSTHVPRTFLAVVISWAPRAMCQ